MGDYRGGSVRSGRGLKILILGHFSKIIAHSGEEDLFVLPFRGRKTFSFERAYFFLNFKGENVVIRLSNVCILYFLFRFLTRKLFVLRSINCYKN